MGNSLNVSLSQDAVVEGYPHYENSFKEAATIDTDVSEIISERVQEVLEGGISKHNKQPRYKVFPAYKERLKNEKHLGNLKAEAEKAIGNCKRKRELKNDPPPHKKAMVDLSKSISKCWMCRKTFIDKEGSLENECVCQTNVCYVCNTPFRGYFSIVEHLDCFPSYRGDLEPNLGVVQDQDK
jgi:hypothetical protein